MFGTILAIGGYFGADLARRGARKGLFKQMLQGGLVKGLEKGAAVRALRPDAAGKKLFSQIYKQHRKQAATFARKASGRGGDAFIRGSIAKGGSQGLMGTRWATASARSGGMMPMTPGQFRNSFGSDLALGVHKYNTLGGLGGVAAMIGMTGIGMQLGGVGGSMGERVPMAPSQEVQNANMYIMPRQAYTQRQRSMQAISMTQLSLRSAFGQEARYMHR